MDEFTQIENWLASKAEQPSDFVEDELDLDSTEVLVEVINEAADLLMDLMDVIGDWNADIVGCVNDLSAFALKISESGI